MKSGQLTLPMSRLIDVHAHIHFAAYPDSKEVIDRSLAAGVWLVNVGTQRDTSKGAVETAEKYQEGVYAAIGLHPIHTDKSYHDEKELGPSVAEAKEGKGGFTSRGEVFDYEYYKKLGVSKKVVAIGECGLDYYRVPQTHADGTQTNTEEIQRKQKDAFEAQIKLSHELQKPLMIHCRSAFPDLISLLKVNSQKLNVIPGIVHFFTGTPEDAQQLKELGFYFSFGGVTTFTKDYDEAINVIGIDRIVLETDAPYVAPAPFRGKRNEPIYIEHTAKAIADKLGISANEVAEKTTAN